MLSGQPFLNNWYLISLRWLVHAEGGAPRHPHAEKIARLAQLKGIGPEFATVWVGEVHRRFDNRRQVAAYVGLAGSPFNSRRTTRDQGISKAGNPKARTTMPVLGPACGRTRGIELAWLGRRHQPQSALSCCFQQRVGTLHGRVRRIAIVALARKLLVASWRDLETGLVPVAAVLKG